MLGVNKNSNLVKLLSFIQFVEEHYYTGWNDKIIVLEKTTWFHFRLMKTGFLFCCWPSTSWSVVYKSQERQEPSIMSESDTMFNERDRRRAAVQPMLSTDPTYDNRTIASTLKMQIWIAMNNRDVPSVIKTKFPATVMVFGVVSSEGYIMPPHIFEVGLKVSTSVPGCEEECGDPLVQSGGRWQTLGVAAGLGAGPQVQRDPGSSSEGVLQLCTLFSLASSSSDLNALDYFVWSYVENITNMTSHNTKASLIAAIRRVFAEYSPALVESVSRRWLRLQAATLNRCQLYYIIKLPELIFSMKVLK